MNRRQKIIVSVTGIFIVLLVLLGLTYAYFLTRITGNGNPTSISVTTANLELVYGDGTTAILTSSNPLMPSSTPIGTKDFTVTNNGDDSEYVVVFEDIAVKYAADTVIDGEAVAAGTPTTFESNDFVYTLTCVVKDKSGNTLTDKSCEGVENQTFPMDGGIVIGNSIDKDDVHNYVLTMYYLDNGLDQSKDMNKALNGKVNIKDIKSINPYSDNTSSLAYNIINNSMLNKNGTELLSKPLTTPAVSVNEALGSGKFTTETVTTSSLCSGTDPWLVGDTPSAAQSGSGVSSYEDAVGKYVYDQCSYWTKYLESYDSTTSTLTFISEKMSTENILTITQDDYGISYYFRGDVDDNYVTFSNMCWRIVRIQGDGSIKLTLESQSPCSETMTSNFSIGTTDWGYKLENDKFIGDYKNSTSGMKNLLNTWFDTNFKSEGNLTNAGLKLKDEEWCLGNTTNTYAKRSPYALLGTTAYENHTAGTEFFYETGRNLYGYGVTPNATLKCNGEKDISKIGALTADEVVYAGGIVGGLNLTYYLKSTNSGWWTLSRSDFSGTGNHAFTVIYDGSVSEDNVSSDYHDVRPAVSLNTGVKITSGAGTRKNPYIINEG